MATAITTELREAFDMLCPHVAGNPYIPHHPHPKQAYFLGMHRQHPELALFEALFGGAAAGGKSDVLLMAAAQYAWKHPEFHAILFRRTHTDLMQPGALLSRAMEWWLPKGVRYDGTNKIFHFPEGAQVAFAYLSNPNDHLRYQSAEYHLTCWDELTHWDTAMQYQYVGLSRVRRGAGCKIPLRTLSASNPGGPGHEWVKERFVGTSDKAAPKLFLPSRVDDNPAVDIESYRETLMHLHPTHREQLLEGNWDARDPGDYFRREWFGPLLDPETDLWPSRDCIRIRWWDLAASEKEDACYTAGVLMARHTRGVRAVEHVRRFRATPGKRDDLIVQTAQEDGHGVVVGIEIEAGSGGPAQFYALERRLKTLGFRVAGARPKAELTDSEGRVLYRNPVGERGKQARADPVASCLERGYQRRAECEPTGGSWWGLDRGKPTSDQQDGLRLFSGPWTRGYLDELEGFPEGAYMDQVDATSGAWAWLEAHTAALQPAMRMPELAVDVVDGHRIPRNMDGKDRRGRWTP